MANSYQSAMDYGINPNGPNAFDINTILDINSPFSGIIFDFPPGTQIILDGDIQANGKIMQFQTGTILVGGEAERKISNAQIDSGYLQQCFDLSITLEDCSTSGDMFSVCWFGAGINPIGGDSQPSLQKASDTVIANFGTMTRTLYLPRLTYNINSPWILHNWNTTINPDEGYYEQWTLNVLGDYNIENSNIGNGAARIITKDDQNFAIGVQRAWCGSIKGISIEGPSIWDEVSFDVLVKKTYEEVNPNTRTDIPWRLSPNAGIVIDPFTGKEGIPFPVDDFYPGLEQWYQGALTTSGTRGFTIAHCNIMGFCVDILNSPNSKTQMGEDCIIDSCRLNYAKMAIAYCQEQSENCVIRNIRSLFTVWTIVDGLSCGRGKGVVGHISNINISFVRQLFNINQVEPLMIEKVYSEGIFSIGKIASSPSTSTVNACAFHFNHATHLQPQIHLDAFNVEFNSCSISYNGEPANSRRIRLDGRYTKFVNVDFDLPPYQVFPKSSIRQRWGFVFDNCRVLNNASLGMNNSMYNLSVGQSTAVAYGNFTLQNDLGLDADSLDQNPTSITQTFHYNCSNYDRVIDRFASHVDIIPDNDRRAILNNIYPDIVRENDIVLDHSDRRVIGRITNITSSSIVISEIPIDIPNLYDISLDLVYFVTIANPIIGDIEAGSNEIKNVSLLFIYNPTYINYNFAPGFRFDHQAFPLGTYIVGYSPTNRILTMSMPSNKDAKRQNFLNGEPVVNVKCMLPPNSPLLANYRFAVPGGTIWTEIISQFTNSPSAPTKWFFNKGGYIDAASTIPILPPPVAPYQAEYNIEPLMRVNNGVIQYFDTYQDIWINV